MDAAVQRVVDWVQSIGIPVRMRDLPQSFLPGLDIGEGGVFVDPARLDYPFDILHEAGHVAVAPPEQRAAAAFTPDAGDEMAAIAWSYAAARALGIPSDVLFHDQYKAGGPELRAAFDNKQYFGVPLLAWYGMCIDPKRATADGPKPYPHMLRWVR